MVAEKLKNEITPNKMQQKAIDILKGQVMLLAGPGTGKTYTVINRIEKMLLDGIEPSSILCLTFSEAAANEMRQRLIKKLGVIASSVDIFTYHSFCNEIIKSYPTQFNLAQGVKLISDTDKITIMQECIDEANLKFFVSERADKYYYTKNFINYIETIKSKRLEKDEYLSYLDTNPNLRPRKKELEDEIYEREQNGKTQNAGRYKEIEKIDKNIGKASELWTLYELYSNKMLDNNLIDFSDMINFVLNQFDKDKIFLKEVSNKYQYFLIDEYQDTNDLQNSIMFHLLEGNNEKNLFVVGDDDQIIYGFQGANINNIGNFLTKYPETEVICLRENNRSTQSILDFSYTVISQDKNRLENNENFKSKNICKKLTAKNPKITIKDKKINRYQFGEKIQETNFIIEDIQKLINSNSCPVDENGNKVLSEIAIIAKKRESLRTFAELLKGKNIPFQIDEGKSIFEIRSSILIYFYMSALCNQYIASDKMFGLMLAEPFKLNLDDYNKILNEQKIRQGKEHNDFITLMQKLNDWKNPTKIRDFLDTYNDLQHYVSNNSLRNSVIEIINRTGILKTYFEEEKNKIENILGIKKLIDEATEFENSDSTRSLNDFVNYLKNCVVNEIDITTEKNRLVQNAIQLTTYHSSKGREFEYVYLPYLTAKNWENYKNAGEYKLIFNVETDKETAEQKKDSELLKLLFVGITRAKHGLTISFSDMEDEKAQKVTKYIASIDGTDFNAKTFEYTQNDFATEFMRNLSRDVHDNQEAFKNELEERVKEIALSPSRMNDYISCPRKFFYTKILKINIEDADWDSANFGTLIHDLLQKSAQMAIKNGKYIDIETIKTEFIKGLDATKFTSIAKKENAQKLGIHIINSYYPHFVQMPICNIDAVELPLEGIEVDGNFITGKIDRVEKNSDGTYSLYDYKTGKPVSSNQVAVGGSKEGYYNQLCFYKYAFEKLTGNIVSQVGLIYVEDHTKSVFKNLGEADMNYIENVIRTTFENIKALNFDPIAENKQGACKFCEYKQLCKLDLM